MKEQAVQKINMIGKMSLNELSEKVGVLETRRLPEGSRLVMYYELFYDFEGVA